jgi:uncharacterized protein
MRVAITGASGLIGSALRRSLEGDGHDVVALVRGDTPGVRWDPDAGTIDAVGLEGVDAVVHLAGEGIGEKRWSDEQKRRIRESRTKGTDLLARTLAGLDRKPSVLVSGSAMGIYGDRGDEVLTEASPPGSGFLPDLVVAWEAATAPAADAGIRVAHVRTGLVLDRKGGALAKMIPLFRMGLGGRMGKGDQWWSWITIDDEVRAIRHLIATEAAEGPHNLSAPNPATNAELTKALGEVLHRPTLLPVPAFGPKLLLGGELATELLFTSIRMVPSRLEANGFVFSHTDIERGLRAVLGKEGDSRG